MAFDAFLKIDGIPGESTDEKHQDWIEVLSFNQGISQPASSSASTSGGASAERVNMSPFEITKLFDKATPKLAEFCCTGQHIKEVLIHLCRAGGDKMTYMEVKLQEVIITNVVQNGSAGAEFPAEKVQMSFGKITWNYNVQKRADGTGAGKVTSGWDLTTNKRIA